MMSSHSMVRGSARHERESSGTNYELKKQNTFTGSLAMPGLFNFKSNVRSIGVQTDQKDQKETKAAKDKNAAQNNSKLNPKVARQQ